MPVNSVKVCARCGGENSRSASVCSHCGARLPNLDLASPSLNHQVDQLVERQTQLREACDKIRNDEISFDDFADFLKSFADNLREKKRKAFILNDEGEPEFDEGDDEAEYQDVAEFEHFRKGIEAMWPFLDEGDPMHLDRGLAIVGEGNDKLIRPTSHQPTENNPAQAQANAAACVLCSTENEVGASVCSNCGAKLPKFDTTSVPQEKHVQVTTRLDQFKKAVARLQAGQWSLQEFGAFLEQVQDSLKAKRETYTVVLTDSGYGEFANEEVTLASSGMDDYDAGVEELWEYLDDRNEQRLDRALELLAQGNTKINSAMVLNRSFRKELTEQFGYI